MLRLPSELIELIILETWVLPVTLEERLHLMTSWTLVSHSWMTVFVRAMAMYVHIPCASYCQLFLRALEIGPAHLESPTWSIYTYFLPRLCRTITFYIYTPFEVFLSQTQRLYKGSFTFHLGRPHPPYIHPQILLLNKTMAFLSKRVKGSEFRFPHLYHLSIHYLNQVPCDGTEESGRFSVFPVTITDLQVTHTFDDRMPKCFWDRSGPGAQWDYGRSGGRHRLVTVSKIPYNWILPSIQRLTVQGACEEAVMFMAAKCSKLVTLRSDADIAWEEHWMELEHFRNMEFQKMPQCVDEKRKRLYRIRCPFGCRYDHERNGIRGILDGISRWMERVNLR